MNKKIGIVLVNYNGKNVLMDCIKSIKNMNYEDYKIILVDNNSSDGSVVDIRKTYTDIIIIETGENSGVAKGNNIGIKKALEIGCEYILLLNNDTEVEENMLSNMLNRADKDVMVTCKMYFYNNKNKIWCAGGKIHWNKGITSHYGENQDDIGQFDESKFVEFTPTCCLLVHKDVFKKIGLMDENYFMYYDDTDFIARCSMNGIRLWYESSAVLWHKVSSTSGGNKSSISVYYSDRNRLYFINKFCENKIIPMSYFCITRIIRLINYRINNKKLFEITMKAIRDYKNNNMYRQEL